MSYNRENLARIRREYENKHFIAEQAADERREQLHLQIPGLAELDKTIAGTGPRLMAIALHKLPEGIATGVGFNAEDLHDAWAVTFGIAIQNIPEEMVIVAPLLIAGVSKLRTIMISIAIAALEVIGVWIGYGLGAIHHHILPAMLAFAGGAMFYVVSDEMIPETHTHGNQKFATYALVAGFVLMLFI